MDCKKFFGRKRAICEGKNPDGTPLKMSRSKRAAYLRRWAGQPEPEKTPPPPPCVHLGDKITDQPCKCGGETSVAVHACQAIQTASGSPKKCVATRKQLRRIKDETLHLVLLACDRCEKYEAK